MESTGESGKSGKIQVSETTAALMNQVGKGYVVVVTGLNQ
jgi:hypothetical protein